MTRQEARERYGVIVTTYRRGYIPFVTEGTVKLIVKCPRTFAVKESGWIERKEMSDTIDMLARQIVVNRSRTGVPNGNG